LIVRLDFHRNLAATSVDLVRLGLSAASKVQLAKIVPLVSIVKVDLRPSTCQIPRNVLIVRQVGRLKLVAPSVSLARLGLSAASKLRRVKVVSSDSIVRVKKKMSMVISRMRVRIQRHACIVQQVGRPKLVAPSVSLARLGLSAASKLRRVKVVSSVSIVRVKNKMPMVISRMRVRIQRHAWIVQQVGRPKQAAPSVNLARLELSAASKAKPVKVVTSDSIVRVKKKMSMVILRKKVQIQRSVLIVQSVLLQKQVVQNVKRVVLGRTVRVVHRAN
jgi:hypothetical protein